MAEPEAAQRARHITRWECPVHGPDFGLPSGRAAGKRWCQHCRIPASELVAVKYVPARDPALSSLEGIASAAWRVRHMLHLNLSRIAAAEDPVLNKNVVDAINDLNEHLPLSEDGWDWEPSGG